jgi:type I restriction enzyme S subunit
MSERNGDQAEQELPEGWDWVELDSVVGPDGLFTDGDWILSDDLKTGHDVRLLQLGDVGVGTFLDKSSKWISGQRFDELKCTEVKPGDVLISRMADPIARACLVPELGVTCITSVDVTICRVRKPGVDPRFVMHALNSVHLREQAEVQASGTTRKRITRRKLARLRLPFPPPAEQSSLADRVDSQLDAIRSGLVAISNAETGLSAFMTGVLRRAFDIGDNPMATIGQLADIVRGVTYKKSDTEEMPAPGMVPLLRATNINETLDFDALVYVPDAVVKPQQRLRVGDIVLAASSGSLRVVGKSARLDAPWDGTFGAFCAVIRPTSDDVDPRFLSWFMASDQYRARVSNLAAGSNINNLKREHLRDMPLPLPAIERQREIVGEIERHVLTRTSMARSLRAARTQGSVLRSALLAAAVVGAGCRQAGETGEYE